MDAAASLVSALLCCSAAAVLLVLRRRRRWLLREAGEGRRRRELALGRMEQAARRFQEQNPDLDAEPILSLSLLELSEKLRDGSLSPDCVFCTYVDKALQVTQEVNCVTDYLQESESQLEKVKRQEKKGLLYGIPVSLKDSINCQGHNSTLGLIKRLNKPAGEDSVVVQVLKRQGAIPFVKTNVPQALLSKKGVVAAIPGQKSVAAGIGPMARDVDSLALCMRALLCDDMFRLDPTVPPMPFNEKVFSSSRPLRIGYYDTDNLTAPSPTMRRAVLETKQLLEKAGHTLVPFKSYHTEDLLFHLSTRGLFADGGATVLDHFKGELEDPTNKELIRLCKVPGWLRGLLSWIVKPLVPRLANTLRNMKEKSVKEVWKLHGEIEEYCREFIAEWRKLDLDVMLCPALGPAFRLGFPGKLSVAVSYTVLYNIMDCPAGVVPVTTVTEEDEEELENYRGHYNERWDKVFVKAIHGGVGLPVAVQCVALPWQEELCLRFMKEVETLTQRRQGNL